MNVTMVTIIVAGATMLALTVHRCLSKSATVSRARVDRAICGMKSSTASPDNLPSIIRNRYAIVSSKEKIKSAFFDPLIRLNQALELLGIQISIRQGVAIIALNSFALGYLTTEITNIDFILTFLISLVFFILATYTFIKFVRNKIAAKFQQLFPDALDLVVRSVRAGLPVSEAIKMISSEVPNPVGSAFKEVGSNLSIGINLNDSLDQLAARIPIAELRFFAISLAVQQETGGNLAEILANLSKLMRKRVNVKKKIRALSSEARASAIIIGSLPFIVGAVIFSFNPQYIEVLFLDDDGRFLMFCALGSIATGGVIMSKLIRFKI